MPQLPITITIDAATIELDPDLFWSDEFSWNAVAQTSTFSIGGALILQSGKKKGGRPITLRPADNDSAWMMRSVLADLQALEQIPGKQFTLTIRGEDYLVEFDRTNGMPIDATPVTFVANPEQGGFGDWWLATLKFITVE